MSDNKTKTTNLNKESIKDLPNNKPVVYKILDKNEENIYTGIAKRGRVKDRIGEHLPNGPDPIPSGIKVKIEQMNSIQEAEKKEKNVISRTKPKHNIKGK